jgi:hypothetical protein
MEHDDERTCCRWLRALALLVHCLWGGCGRAALDGGIGPGGDAGGLLSLDAPASAPAGGPYEMCGDPVPCLDGLRAMQVGSTCFCQPKCGPGDRGANAPGCPRPSSGLADPVCDGTDWCEIPCTT